MLLLLATLAHAQITPVAPFTGVLSGDLEAQPLTTAPVPCVDVLDDEAALCAPEADFGGVQVRDRLYLQCLLEAHGGERMAGSNDGAATIHFDLAVQRFGAWLGTHAHDGDLTVELYGFDGTLLHTDTQPFGGNCTWGWRGYESAGPAIWSVRFVHSDHGGAFVDVDDLQVEPRCDLDDRDCDGVPAAEDCDDLDPRRTPGAPEVCDGVDSDCDGETPSTEIDADGDGYPACAECADDDPARHPGADEICNGLDDDCSGTADDHLGDAPLATRQQGVCAGAEQVCLDGAWVDPDYAMLPHFESDERSCDGLDNDCDGAVDDLDDPPAVGPGVCAEVLLRCEGEQGWVEPDGWEGEVPYHDPEYLCDGLDNDCDGEVDEALGEDPSTCPDLVCTDGAWAPPPEEHCPTGPFGGCATSGGPPLALAWLLPLVLIRRRAGGQPLSPLPRTAGPPPWSGPWPAHRRAPPARRPATRAHRPARRPATPARPARPGPSPPSPGWTTARGPG